MRLDCNLLAQLFHFPVGICILQSLVHGIGNLRGANPQSCHGTYGLHGLHRQFVVLGIIA